MTGFLLDTNVLSETRKPRPHGAVVAWLQTVDTAEIAVSAFSVGEIQSGIELTRKNDPVKALELESWLDRVVATHRVLALDADCMREWARIMAGRPVDLKGDALIAATARVHGLTVATRNIKDFERLGVALFNPFEFRG